MQSFAKTFAVFVFFAVTAHADWTLSDYPLPATDSAAANRMYGIRAFSNPASATKVKVDSGRVVFHADYASDSTEGNSANVGFVHDLKVGEGPLNLSDLTAISFQLKCSAPITGGLEISLGSDAYSPRMLEAGAVFKHVLEGSRVACASPEWITATIDIKDFYVEGLSYDSLPRMEAVLKKLTHLRIVPRSSYKDSGERNGIPCAKCVHPTMPSLDIEVREIVLKSPSTGPLSWPLLRNDGCEPDRPFELLDDFVDGDEENEFGGYWYAWTDSGDVASANDMADKTKGSSRAGLTIAKGGIGFSGYATLTAKLDKRLGGTQHPDAGWASLAVGFAGDGLLSNADGVTGIQFLIKAERFSKSVESIRFKVRQKGIPDSAAFFVTLPVSELSEEGGRVACIRAEDFHQPFTLDPSHRAVFSFGDMLGLVWEVKIADRLGGFTDTASAQFWLSDVSFQWRRFIGVHDRSAPSRGLSLRASNGILHLSGTQGFQRFEVVSMQGRKVASFAPAPSIALDLPRGTYHLVGMRDGAKVVKTFAVVR